MSRSTSVKSSPMVTKLGSLCGQMTMESAIRLEPQSLVDGLVDINPTRVVHDPQRLRVLVTVGHGVPPPDDGSGEFTHDAGEFVEEGGGDVDEGIEVEVGHHPSPSSSVRRSRAARSS